MAAELKILDTEEQDIAEGEEMTAAETVEPMPEGEVIDDMTAEVKVIFLEVIQRMQAQFGELTGKGEEIVDGEAMILQMPEDADETIVEEEKMAA